MFQFYFNALVKGVIEGVTEFLPISSTGHLILARDWFPLTADLAHSKELDDIFDLIIQLPAILAVGVLYRARLWESARAIRTQPRARNFWLGLFIAFLPAAVGLDARRFGRAARDDADDRNAFGQPQCVNGIQIHQGRCKCRRHGVREIGG